MVRDRTPYDVDPYSILGEPCTVSQEELKKAHHAGCMKHHLDKADAKEKFKQIGMT